MTDSFGKSYFLCLFFVVFVLALIPFSQTLAQSNGGLTLGSSPTNPGPNERVVVSLQQYSINTYDSTIRWYVNDVEQTEFKNLRSLELVMGDLGETTNVRVTIQQSSGVVLSGSLKLRSVTVDLILEADTYVPYFYGGRPLPSRDASIRAIAIPHDGTANASNYSYKWSIDDGVLFGGASKGNNVIDLTMPRFGSKRLMVEVIDSSGNVVAKNYITLKEHAPEIHFYEENPLKGVGFRPINDDLILLGEEVTISGEPYYIRNSLSSPRPNFNWKIDGRSVSSGIADENRITLRAVGNTGSANVKLETIIKDSLSQFFEGGFKVIFN